MSDTFTLEEAQRPWRRAMMKAGIESGHHMALEGAVEALTDHIDSTGPVDPMWLAKWQKLLKSGDIFRSMEEVIRHTELDKEYADALSQGIRDAAEEMIRRTQVRLDKLSDGRSTEV